MQHRISLFVFLFHRRNSKHALARHKALQWTKSYILPEFPYDVKCMLAEQKCPDHSMRIRIIEFLQADMTKYLEGSLWVATVRRWSVLRGEENLCGSRSPWLMADKVNQSSICGFRRGPVVIKLVKGLLHNPQHPYKNPGMAAYVCHGSSALGRWGIDRWVPGTLWPASLI